MSQWSVNEVTEGILFSVILFTSCEFLQMVLIKKEKTVGGGKYCNQNLISIYSERWEDDRLFFVCFINQGASFSLL